MKIIETGLPGVVMLEPRVFEDSRGFFLETYHAGRYREVGVPELDGRNFVQDNHSYSIKGTLRGLHYQLKNPQGKLLYVISGEVFDVAVDIRKGSPTFGQWYGAVLSSENKRQLYISEGFAHGFYVMSDTADVTYKCTDVYTPGDDFGLLWSDQKIGIEWPISEKVKIPLLSEKDALNPTLDSIDPELLPVFK